MTLTDFRKDLDALVERAMAAELPETPVIDLLVNKANRIAADADMRADDPSPAEVD